MLSFQDKTLYNSKVKFISVPERIGGDTITARASRSAVLRVDLSRIANPARRMSWTIASRHFEFTYAENNKCLLRLDRSK